ncbi:unnamed protein product [Ilex paraguariensis]|uniref:Glutaredoxin domain-containing protein n=1 Tax=Ilex paraguariensis TaxID=185542 RepID=A0ABC8UY23_9AQUA
MGCSASRSHTILTRPTEDHQKPFSNSPYSQSPCSYSYSDSSSTPVSRTLSLPTPLVLHPPLRKGDTNHLVSLTSTTYGSLILIDPIPNPNFNGQDGSNSLTHIAKTQIPKDPIDPSSPDSVINTWELMEGLDDWDFDIIQPPIESPRKPNLYPKSDSNGSINKDSDVIDMVKSFEIVEHSDSKPLWKHLSEESLLAKMDPNVVLSYRKALSSRQLGVEQFKDVKPKVIRPIGPNSMSSLSSSSEKFYLKGTEDRIVLYHTSLRGIRKTFEDCGAVRMIFRGFRVFVDERDISMDSMYRNELQSVLGGKAVSLPQVFIRGKHIGGVDEINQLHEVGQLAKLLEGFPAQDPGIVCDSCGDARFVPCLICNGSRKVFEEEERKVRRCSDCNENGLIRCPNCCS